MNEGSVHKFAVSFAALPTRIGRLTDFIAKIDRWKIQPDRIFLVVSPYYHRLKLSLEPSQLPAALSSHPKLEILWREDLGPINKLFWVLKERSREFDSILTLDDDRDYPPSTSADLLDGARRFESAVVCLRGRQLDESLRYLKSRTLITSRQAEPVDIALGTEGILYPTRLLGEPFFDRYLEMLEQYPFIRFVDDIYISGYLASHGVPRWVVPSSVRVGDFPAYPRYLRAFRKLIKHVFQNCGYPLDDSLWGINSDGDNNDQAIRLWSEAWRSV